MTAAVRSTNLQLKGGTTDFENNKAFDAAGDLVTTFNAVIDSLPPIGGIMPWHKTFYSKATGTNTSTSSSKLIDSGATFQTAGVAVGMIVYNSSDATFSYVVSVDSQTQLTLAANIFTATPKNYTVYATPRLSTRWLECNGQTVSDANSPYNGQAVPDMNGTPRFARGGTTSGGTGGSDTKNMSHSHTGSGGSGNGQWLDSAAGAGVTTHNISQQTSVLTTQDILPAYMTHVFIIRIK